MIDLVLDIAAICVAVIIVLGAVRLGSIQYALIAPHDAEGVPFLPLLGFASGLTAATALLLSTPHPGEFALHRIFAPDSIWNVTLSQFLARHALPSKASIDGLLDAFFDAGGSGRLIVTLSSTLFVVLGLAVCVRSWGGAARGRAVASFVVLALWTTLIVHYAVHLVAWGGAQLGFWTFLLLLLGLQRWRHRAQRSNT